MVFGVRKNILRKLQKFETNKITITGLKRMLFETYQPFFIWGRTEGKTKPSRTFSRAQMYSIEGPGGRAMSGAQYWVSGRYVRDGYIILFDTDASPAGFRTFPIHRIEKIEKDGVIYEVV